MTIIHMGADHAGLQLKNAVRTHLESTGHSVHDHGTLHADSTDYPNYAHAVCAALMQDLDAGVDAVGILVCGSGIGMSITANRHPGIRAALCTCEFHARGARQHNNANVICLGERVSGQGLALDMVDIFLATPFAGGRHERRVALIDAVK